MIKPIQARKFSKSLKCHFKICWLRTMGDTLRCMKIGETSKFCLIWAVVKENSTALCTFNDDTILFFSLIHVQVLVISF